MPVGIGYVASYALSQVGGKNIEVRLYDDAKIMMREISDWRPHLIGLSNYCWDSNLSRLVFRYAKKDNPAVVCIAGGPEFPGEIRKRKDYLNERSEIDFYVMFDGEVAFASIVQKLIDSTGVEYLKQEPQKGMAYIDPNSRDLVVGELLPRIKNLDDIPSPYLGHLLDDWFNGQYAPFVVTTRGCPFTCGYCYAGQKWHSALSSFSTQRIKEELLYCATKLEGRAEIPLAIADTNFGMYTRDEEIAAYCRHLQDTYGWPVLFDLTTGKTKHERVLKISSLLKNGITITCSFQSTNPKTLAVINRRNLPIAKYQEIQEEIKKRGMLSIAEFIAPLPEETKLSYLRGMKTVIDAGVEMITPYTTMLLKGTFLASEEVRKKYDLRTKFRILPRQFGDYLGEKCFEIEEVCVATNTISFNEYIEIRGFALISAFFSGEQFDVIHKHLKETKISKYDFCNRLWEVIESGSTPLSNVYDSFLHETRAELWPSQELVYDHYSKVENYEKLLTGEVGDNLLRKYSTKMLLESCLHAIELAYLVLKEMTCTRDAEMLSALDASKHWVSFTRNINKFVEHALYPSPDGDNGEVIELAYDVHAWYINSTTEPITAYKGPVCYRVFYDREESRDMIAQITKAHGDRLFAISKLLTDWSIKDIWSKFEKQEGHRCG
jgi:radical SAM superfamily enzyme YgiQ (UPF0313 family)